MLKPPRQTITRTTLLPNGQTHEEEIDLLKDFSWRNFFSTINFAKIMQKLSKHRSHRIRMLVQYKSSVRKVVESSEATLLTSVLDSLKAHLESPASNASITRIEADQEPSAILWSEMAAV